MRKKMSRLRNEEVLQKWKDGDAAASHTGALCTDGTSLFSYKLKIGHRSRSGVTIVGDFTSPGGSFHSITTSCHVGKASAVADHTMHPVVFKNSEFIPNED
tara:strand:+ start:1386 stop:1688 length:303 start_codon:yes stop_codon:yes gene_type:complete